MSDYVNGHEVITGDLVFLADTSTTPSRVVERREPRDGIAASLGAVVVEVETYCMQRRGWLPRRPVTVWPDDQPFRRVPNPHVWTV